MKFTHLRTNHLTNPVGHALTPLSLSWVADSNARKQVSARVEIALDKSFTDIVSDSGVREDLSGLGYTPDLSLKPHTRYWWRVTVTADNGDTGVSEPAYFETGKMDESWTAPWITASYEDKDRPFILKHDFDAADVVKARAYVCGLGSYELWINGKKATDEVLLPGSHAYDFWLQTQTYDLTGLIQNGENTIGAIMTPGWYMGRFGFGGAGKHHYGDTMKLIAEIHLEMSDGSEKIITTGEDWLTAPSFITDSGIYDGEHQDRRLLAGMEWSPAVTCEGKTEFLTDRYSPRIAVTETLKPLAVLHTPKNETVIDFGQNMTGWVEFDCDLPAGTRVWLGFGELMQDDCFYRDNLRSAKAEFSFVSDGKPAHVRPYGTFFGFRYVKVEGMEVDPAAFTACVIHSEMDRTGEIVTSDERINRLFLNANWSQRDNFLDVPTDCPQRDERMGWTGDAQIFAGTACFNMYTPAFYAKYMEDLMYEQKPLNGGVPHVIPAIKPAMIKNHSSCAWGDVACVLPWQLYQYYGDKEMLRRHYPAMKGWVDFIKGEDDADGGKRLWQTGFHYADWLALDNYKDPKSCYGGTDCYFVASAYYAYSTVLTAKAARALGEDEEAAYYENLAAEIKAAIVCEYFSPNGRCVCDTQTALVVALYMDLVPESYRPRLIADLRKKLRANNMHLNTGFVGTPYLCPTLSEIGAAEDAYTLLFNDDYPSWLYEVKLGATTIWERWNSVLADGHISDTIEMNSLNHYAYGSIVEWMYRYMCGLRPVTPGCTVMRIEPQPDPRLQSAKAAYDSASGRYESGWEYDGDTVKYTITVPFNCEAEVVLPGREAVTLTAGSYTF